MSTEPTEEFEKAAVRLLALLIKLSGWTRRRLDAHLGYSVGYMSRLLTGNTKLLYTHILEILNTIGLEPARFFDVLHPGTSPQHLLEILERARRIGQGVEEDPALLPIGERVRVSVDRFRVEFGERRVRDLSPRQPKSAGGKGASPRKRRTSAAKRSS